MDLVTKYLGEGSKEDALGALKAILGFLEKQKNPSDDGKEMLKMAKGIKKYADGHDGKMTPDQAEWVANTSNAIRMMIKNPGKKL